MIPLRDNQATHRLTPVNVLLVLGNIAVFVYEMSLTNAAANAFFDRYALIPYHLAHPFATWEGTPVAATLVTSIFLHGGLLHVGGNMLYLFIFGAAVEERMGHGRYLCFYLASGIAAGVATVAMAPQSGIPVIGASGAIAGVLGAYLIFYPRARILTIWPIFILIEFIELPAILYLMLWFVLQLYSGLESQARGPLIGGVAWWAHIGGFLFGIALGPIVARHGSASRRRLR